MGIGAVMDEWWGIFKKLPEKETGHEKNAFYLKGKGICPGGKR